jgi:hypothetical protein
VKRTFAAVLAIALLAVGCAGTASPSPSALVSNSPVSAPPSVDLAKAAHDQLCNPQGGGSLSKVASQLDKLDPKADTSQLQATLGTLLLNLQQLQVDATTKPTRDAAGTAVLQLQSSLNDSSKRQQAATNAASSLRAVETAVCK